MFVYCDYVLKCFLLLASVSIHTVACFLLQILMHTKDMVQKVGY